MSDETKPTEGASNTPPELNANLYQNWQKEIEQAQKREKDFRKKGTELCKIFEACHKDSIPYNILYSNTETLAPAVYNSVPRPKVSRRFKGPQDNDPLALAAADVAQRLLAYLIDSDVRDYPTFDSLMRSSVQEALVPGRGLIRFKYDAIIVKQDPETGSPQDAGAEKDIAEGTPADDPAQEAALESEKTGLPPQEHIESETVHGEKVGWNRVLYGFAWNWKDVPWVAYEWPMSVDELEKNFGRQLCALIEKGDIEADGSDEDGGSENLHKTTTKGAWVYEIWDKTTRKVIFYSPSYKLGVLKMLDDPLGLTGFYSTPEPLQFARRISTLVPLALYEMYEEQAKELNSITIRIKRLVKALKVRGFYDQTVTGIPKVFEADDNVFIPLENVAALMGQGFTLDKALFMVPIEKLVSVLQQLYTQREQVKRVIFEITGIADIMRGSSQASETLGAQEIKTQWGTMRLKKAQAEVARYARDCLRLMAEVGVTKLSPNTIRKMTGVDYPLQAEKEQAMMVVQEQGASGQQPDPQFLATAQKPSMEEICDLLRDDLQRSYRIDIETNSTVDLEATEDKQDMAELMNSISQFLNGVAPAVEKGVLPFEAAKAMLLGVIRKFRFGEDVEKQIMAMQAPQKPQDGEAAAAAEKVKAEVTAMQAKAEMDKMTKEMQLREQEHNFRLRELAQKAEMAERKHALDMEKLMMQAALPAPAAGGKRPAKSGQSTRP